MPELIAQIATSRPNEAALVDETGTTTWAELDDRTNRLINGLRSIGVGPGSVVAAVLANTREYFELFVAAAHGGFLVVPVNWHWVADELAFVLRDSGATVLFADARFVAVTVAALEEPGTTEGLSARIAVGQAMKGFVDYEAFLADADPGAPANQVVGGPMFYTSGTTGRPKGVRGTLLGDGSVPASLLSLLAGGFASSMGLPSPSVSLLDGPLYHSAQWAFSVFPLLGGSTIVMRHKFDPVETLRTIDEHGVTNLHLVPTQFVRLLRATVDAKRAFRGDTLRVVWHGAAPCPPEVKRSMIEWWGPKIVEYYGGTEGGIVSSASSEEWLARPGTLGKPQATMEVRIVDDAGTIQPTGTSGTIYLRSLMGMDFQYHGDAEKTAKAHLEPGVFTLGDIGYLDVDGYLYMSDRKIDMIISGGVNIYPAEIEGVLITHPAVRDVAVIGVPNDEFGEEVKAIVELEDGPSGDDRLRADLLALCRTKLAGYKVPRSLDFESTLPRTATGKLQKRLVRDRYWLEAGRTI